MSVLDKYIYKNCFELNNKNHDINNYLFDASFSYKTITDVSDCANYAYYNNHPSFFFKNKYGEDVSKCYVFKYDNLDHNSSNIDKISQFNTIANLNYDLNNNKNLPRYNFTLKDTTKSGSGGTDPDVTQCNNGSLKYYLLKSFSNSYNINYNNIKKRTYKNGTTQNINQHILTEYYRYLRRYNSGKITEFVNNYVQLMPYFEHLYHNDINNTTMYKDMIFSYIDHTLMYAFIYGTGLFINNTMPDNSGTLFYYNNRSNMPETLTGTETVRKNPINIKLNGNSADGTNDILYFNDHVYTYPLYLGLPKNLFLYYKKQYNTTADDIIEFDQKFFTPVYYWEENIHNIINRFFFIFVIYELKTKADEVYTTPPSYNTLYNDYNSVNKKTQFDNPVFNSNGRDYNFSYNDIIYCLYKLTNKDRLYSYRSITDKDVSIFLKHLIIDNNYVNQASNPSEPTNYSDSEISNHIKVGINSEIVGKFLLTHDSHNHYNTAKTFVTFYRHIYRTSNLNLNTMIRYTKLFKSMYTGEFRIHLIEHLLVYRIKVLEDENNIIKNDLHNIKTYIDNIYLHSKLKNIEEYIYNEKSKLKYLFNKNSSEKQKNNDLNFLNNFILIENIIICIIIFILILFFIKK